MPQSVPNYIWRKRVTREWLEQNELRLDSATSGIHSIVERPGVRRLLIEMFCERARTAQDLAMAFGGAMDELPRNWHSRFLASHRMKPLRIGRRLLVVGDAKDLADDSRATSTLVIPAGAAFGTGDHATTAMSLRLLERISRQLPGGWRMLDAGTGSGILALAGKRFGAGKVVAIDHDRTAIATARENARVNGIAEVRFVVGDVKAHVRGKFDIITANLYSELLEAAMPQFRASLAENGNLILSGVLRTQEAGLARSLRRHGFQIAEVRRRGKWIALLAVQPRS